MAIQFCPECHQPMSNVVHGIRLPVFKAALFKHIEKRPDWSGQELASYFDKSDACIRSHIWQINDLLMDTGISIRGGSKFGYSIHNKRKGKK